MAIFADKAKMHRFIKEASTKELVKFQSTSKFCLKNVMDADSRKEIQYWLKQAALQILANNEVANTEAVIALPLVSLSSAESEDFIWSNR